SFQKRRLPKQRPSCLARCNVAHAAEASGDSTTAADGFRRAHRRKQASGCERHLRMDSSEMPKTDAQNADHLLAIARDLVAQQESRRARSLLQSIIDIFPE